MRSPRVKFMFSVIVSVAIAGSASAAPQPSSLPEAPAQPQPQQTPQNAQLFLSTVAKQYAVTVYPGIYNESNSLDINYRWLDAVAEGTCVTRFEAGIGSFVGRDNAGAFSSGPTATFEKGGQENLPRLAEALKFWSIKGFPYVVNWSKAVSAKQTNRIKVEAMTSSGNLPAKQAVILTTSDATFAFYFPSEELATRVAYAMEFLRMSCDKTAQTGF